MKKMPLSVMEALTCRKLVIVTSVSDISYSDGKVYSEAKE